MDEKTRETEGNKKYVVSLTVEDTKEALEIKTDKDDLDDWKVAVAMCFGLLDEVVELMAATMKSNGFKQDTEKIKMSILDMVIHSPSFRELEEKEETEEENAD